MVIQQLTGRDILKLKPCLLGLAAYHNSIASSFSGIYPFLPPDHILEAMIKQEEEGKAIVEALMDNEIIKGFSKISFELRYGSLDYLYVSQESRGQGYGKQLMDRAMAALGQRDIDLIDIKVLAGNPSVAFYESYGFKVRSHIMSLTRRPA